MAIRIYRIKGNPLASFVPYSDQELTPPVGRRNPRFRPNPHTGRPEVAVYRLGNDSTGKELEVFSHWAPLD